jgi:hypothetical protein
MFKPDAAAFLGLSAVGRKGGAFSLVSVLDQGSQSLSSGVDKKSPAAFNSKIVS